MLVVITRVEEQYRLNWSLVTQHLQTLIRLVIHLANVSENRTLSLRNPQNTI